MPENKYDNVVIVASIVIAIIILSIAYLPNIYPEGYARLRQNRLIHLVPIAAVIQIAGTVGLIRIKTQEDRNE